MARIWCAPGEREETVIVEVIDPMLYEASRQATAYLAERRPEL